MCGLLPDFNIVLTLYVVRLGRRLTPISNAIAAKLKVDLLKHAFMQVPFLSFLR
jgi:hypothetical protein